MSPLADTGSPQESAPAAADATLQSPLPEAFDFAHWGAAPATVDEKDAAVSRRWIVNTNIERAKWGLPLLVRDPYLDWMAENNLHRSLGEAEIPLPAGLVKSARHVASPESWVGIGSQESLWTIGDELDRVYRSNFSARLTAEHVTSAAWTETHPGQDYYSLDSYIQAKLWLTDSGEDRFRLIGVAGRIRPEQVSPLRVGPRGTLDQIAPGAAGAYAPQGYVNVMISIVATDPWLLKDGTQRP